MFKKSIFIFILFFTQIQAGQDDLAFSVDSHLNQLIYAIGMTLVNQKTICNDQTAQNACMHICQNIPIVQEFIQSCIERDSEMIAYDVSSVDNLIAYTLEEYPEVWKAVVLWLAAFQNVFVVFYQLHPDFVSFDIWSDDMAYLQTLQDALLPDNSAYAHLQQACFIMFQRQSILSNQLHALHEF